MSSSRTSIRFPRNLFLCLCVSVAASFNALQAAPPTKPNIVLILVDDLGWADIACQGSKYYETPNIDRLAKQGVRFTDAYAACAVCSPTRAAVLTGRYPARVGITDWIRSRFQGGKIPENGKNPTKYVAIGKRPLACPPNPLWMEHEEVTIAEALKPAGYTSCHIGKWHLGADDWYPEKQGFDLNIGGCDYGQPPSYFDPYVKPRQGDIPTLKPRKKGEYLTDREADEAEAFIRANSKRPFFLYLANYAVHTPIQARADLTKLYEAKTKTNQANAKYAAMVHSVDQCVGQITRTLKELELVENTLIIFTSDNGGLDNKGNPTDNAPLRSGKGYPYEGGIRVPLIIKWPAHVPAGKTSSEPATSVDLMPTILDAAGLDQPNGREIDGVSLLPHLASGAAKPLNRQAIYWHFPHYRHGDIVPYSIIRQGRWKMIKHYEGPTFELFDLDADLSESAELSAARPGVVKQLDQQLVAHLKSVGAKLPRKRR